MMRTRNLHGNVLFCRVIRISDEQRPKALKLVVTSIRLKKKVRMLHVK